MYSFEVKEKEELTFEEVSKRFHVGITIILLWQQNIEPIMKGEDILEWTIDITVAIIIMAIALFFAFLLLFLPIYSLTIMRTYLSKRVVMNF